MEWAGGIALARGLKDLEDALGDYYGTLNEVKLGLTVEHRPVKPQALIYAEQMQLLGIPLVDGGVLDQPYIFMQEYKIVSDIQKLHAILEAANDDSNRSE